MPQKGRFNELGKRVLGLKKEEADQTEGGGSGSFKPRTRKPEEPHGDVPPKDRERKGRAETNSGTWGGKENSFKPGWKGNWAIAEKAGTKAPGEEGQGKLKEGSKGGI